MSGVKTKWVGLGRSVPVSNSNAAVTAGRRSGFVSSVSGSIRNGSGDSSETSAAIAIVTSLVSG